MFKIYSSSAGSGKTYTLTREYLKLALHPSNDSYYRHILAVTFTNAAAQEMKDRIINTLRIFAEGKEHPMLGDILRELYPKLDQEPELLAERQQQLRLRASRIFTRILHGYSDFSVMTIDSFMSRLVGSFTDELGLPFGFETRLDTDLLTEAIDRLLARIGTTGEEYLTNVLEQYYLEHAREEGGWGSIPKQMQSVAGDLLNEQSYLAMSRVSDLSLQDWQQIRKQLVSFVKAREAEINELASAAMSLISNNGLNASDFHQTQKGIYGYFQSRSQRNSPKLWETPNSYVRKTIEEDKWTPNKIPVSTQAVVDSITGSLREFFSGIEEIRIRNVSAINLYKSLIGQLYNLSLLNEIKKEFDTLLRKHNQVHISEFNRKIIDIVASDPVPFIFERLGEKYNHILIDEFQDTSKLQFANLLPLIENALANGYFNLIVGDVKQAIYRFRGGDMELLLKLTSDQAHEIAELLGAKDPFVAERLVLLSQNTHIARLVTNRRSFREVTEFNNSFFQFLSESDATGSALTKAVYDTNFHQEIGEFAPAGGCIEIEFFQDTGSEENDETKEQDSDQEEIDVQIQRVISLIGNLRTEGYEWRDIALLCRYKKDSASLATWLQEAGIPLISDDSLLLTNSVYISLVIQFIRVIHAPDHFTNRLETALNLYQITTGKIVNGKAMETIVSISRETGLGSFLSWMEGLNIHFNEAEIYQIGLYELCEQIIARFNLPESKLENQYLFRFLDEVLKFESTRVSHLGDFLSWWENSAASFSIASPADTNAVRITTIHKSKGLEYPVVLVPYADWKVTPKAGSRIWVDLEEASATDPLLSTEGKPLLSAAVPMNKTLEETALSLQYQQEVDRVLLENINLVYVAFTRPVQRLYVLAALPVLAKDGSIKGGNAVNSWLQAYLQNIGEWNLDKLRYTLTDGSSSPAHSHMRIASNRFTITSGKGNKEATTLSLKKNADKAFYTETFEKERNFVQRVRQVLIQTKSASSLEETVRKYTLSGLLRNEETEIALAKIRKLISLPVLSPLFAEECQKVSRQIIGKDGQIEEIDRLVRTPENAYAMILFVPVTESGRKRLQRLLHAGFFSGLTPLQGYLVDISEEKVEIVQPTAPTLF